MSHLCFNKYIYIYVSTITALRGHLSICLCFSPSSHSVPSYLLCSSVRRRSPPPGNDAQASLHAFGLNAQQIVFVWITCLAHYFRFPEHSNWAWAVAARCQTSDPTAELAEVCDDAHTLRRNFWWICLLQLLDERLLAAIHRDETYCVFLLLSCTFADIYCSSSLHFSP